MEMAIWGLAAYLSGSVPFGLLIAKARGVDLRNAGSGNLGATNVFRCVGKGWGVLTFAFDALKGFLPAFFFPHWAGAPGGEWGLLFGILAILGHGFPVWLHFKGGKGVATSAGMLLGVAPAAVGVGFVCWLATVLVSRYVSLASIVAALATAATVWMQAPERTLRNAALTALAALVIWLHRANVERLMNGTEHRFGKKKSDEDA